MEIDMKLAKKRYGRMARSNKRRDRIDALGNVIELRLTFEEWLQIWIDSGKWDLCGHKKGCYVMSRFNDIGHYELGNVFIQTHSDNVRQALEGKKRKSETCEKLKGTHSPERVQSCRDGFTEDVCENLRLKAIAREAAKKERGEVSHNKGRRKVWNPDGSYSMVLA